MKTNVLEQPAREVHKEGSEKGRTITLRPGRPTKYTKETARRVMKYIKKCQEKSDFITIEHLASELGIGTRTLYSWEEIYPEFQQTMDMLRDAQRDQLLRGGVSNKFNARFSEFLLKANHGMQDRQPPINATQNNYLGISRELMADAIKLIREKDPDFMRNYEEGGDANS